MGTVFQLPFEIESSPEEDELAKAVDIYEVKADRSRYDPTLLKAKIAALTEKHPALKDRLRNVAVLSLEDM